MGKNSKTQQTENKKSKKKIIKTQKIKYERKNLKDKKEIYKNYFKNIFEDMKNKDTLKKLFELLKNCFHPDKKISEESHKKIEEKFEKINISNVINNYNNYNNLLSETEFYDCFLIKIKQLFLSENYEILESNYNSIYYNFFKTICVQKKFNDYLFNKNKISSFIRQDLILTYFDDIKNFENYIPIIYLDDIWYSEINENNLLIDENINDYQKNFLFLPLILSNIEKILLIFGVNNNEIKDLINSIITKIKFFHCPLPEKLSSLTCLGNNILIRNYFYKFKNNTIKIPLKIIITRELIKVIILNLISFSFISNNCLINKIENFYENILLGGKIIYYSLPMINYLKDKSNYSKSREIFSKDIQNFFSFYKIYEDYAKNLSDVECINYDICRTIKI
jgi:hypothetical protein